MLGVSRRTVLEWIARGCPTERGRYDLVAIAQWRADNVAPRPGAAAAVEAGATPLAAQKLQLEIAEKRENVRAKRLRNRSKAGRLVDRGRVEREISVVFQRIRARLEAAPDEMEMRFPLETRAENKAEFANFVRLLLKEMSNFRLSQEDA